jgi:transcriptional regulator with XRE-family HTH domain
MITFGEWVTAQRESRGLTKTECARRAGFSAQRWAQIEQATRRREDTAGVPRVHQTTAQRVAHALGVPVTEALRAAGYANIQPPSEEPAVIAYYNALPHDVQEDVLEMLRVLYRRYHREGRRRTLAGVTVKGHRIDTIRAGVAA